MKQLFKLLIAILLCSSVHGQTGYYDVTGYFFNISLTRSEDLSKNLIKINSNTYQAMVGDLNGYGYFFQFSIDTGNNLVNWVPIGNTPGPTDEGSGFMHTDNPGHFVFPGLKQPGDSPWVHSTYNNTYDPATHTFYMHYGYTNGNLGENNYTRQIYEKWVYHDSTQIFSFSPANGTSGTTVTIKGAGLLNAKRVLFGNNDVDTFDIKSDSEITAILGSGGSGDVIVTGNYGSDTMAGFSYTVPVVTDTGWVNAGNPYFSPAGAKNPTIALSKDDKVYVVFTDSQANNKAQVMRLNNSNQWINVGGFVSDGACSLPNIAVGTDNTVFVSYIDSLHDNNCTVKKFSNNSWVTLGEPGFAPEISLDYFNNTSLILDTNNIPYISSSDIGLFTVKTTIFKFDNGTWSVVGNSDVGTASVEGVAALAIDKRSNTLYVAVDDTSSIFNVEGNYPVYYAGVRVKKFINNQWLTVGKPNFAVGSWGNYEFNLHIDTSGNPVVSFMEDNGREKASMYTYYYNDWVPVGDRFFTPGHAEYICSAIDAKNNPYVFFYDSAYNKNGSVMHYDKAGNNWTYTGARGFAPTSSITASGIVVNKQNIPYVVFADKAHNNQVRVMYYPKIVLAEKLITFNGFPQNNNAILQWQATHEVSNDYYIIQRSNNGITFSDIAKVAATNSAGISEYNYTDVNALSNNSQNVYYRLAIVDNNAKTTYSNIVLLRSADNNLTLVIKPNPVNNQLTFQLNTANTGSATIRVFNSTGNKLIETTKPMSGTSLNATVNVANLPSGVYYLSVTVNNKIVTERFQKN